MDPPTEGEREDLLLPLLPSSLLISTLLWAAHNLLYDSAQKQDTMTSSLVGASLNFYSLLPLHKRSVSNKGRCSL